MDPIEVDSSAPPPVTTGVAPNTDAPPTPDVQRPADVPMRTAGLAPPDDGGKPKDHWWAHEENIVPLLTGLAAMGTAPTRHLGVALSAGLGAGAGSWLPAQQQEAEIQQQRAQAGITQTTLANYKGTGSSQMPTPQPVRPSGMAQGAPGDPQEVAFSKYAPVPTARPDSVAQRVTQLSFANPNAARAYGEQYDQGVKNELQRRQLTANSDYQGFVRVNGAAPGQAVAELARVDPQKAAELQNSNPITADQQARTYAQQMGLSTHQYSGRPVDMKNGVLTDGPSGAQVLGSEQLMVGLSPEQKAAAFEDAITPRVYGAGLPEAPYKHFKFASPLAMVMAKDQASRVSGATGVAGAAGAAPTAAPTGVAPQNTPPSAPPQTAPPQPSPPIKPTTRPQKETAPVQSLAHPNSVAQTLPGVDINSIPKLPGPPPVVDQVSKTNAENINLANLKVKNDALDTYKEQVLSASRNASLYSQLDQKLATADPRAYGPTSQYYKAYQGLVTALQGGNSPGGLTNQAEVDKFLTMLGVGGSRQLIGADQQMRQMELLTLMQHANPNMNQPLAAIRALVAYGKANNQFDMLGGNTAMQAITAGANPRDTASVIDTRRSEYVQGVLASTPVRTGMYGGQKVTQYADGTVR